MSCLHIQYDGGDFNCIVATYAGRDGTGVMLM